MNGLRTKLALSEPGNQYEREADRIAARIMRSPQPTGQRMEQRPVNSPPASTEAPSIVHEVLSSPGQSLDPLARAFFEPRFGHNFSNVSIHTGVKATQSARAVNALAYTIGDHLVFGGGQYAPGTSSGRKLLAHELAHVVQDRAFTGLPPSGVIHRLEDIAPSEAAEEYLPDIAELTDHLDALTLEKRAEFIKDYLTEVKLKWGRAEAAGLLGKLKKVRSAETKMKTSHIKPVAGLPQNQPSAFREYLMTDATGSAATLLGRQLVLGEVTVDKVSESGSRAAEAVMNLRRLDEVLTRILSAQEVASMTGTPLQNVLAMYRVEGDINMPPSEASLSKGIPSGTSEATTSLDVRPDVTHLVWLADEASLVGGSSASDEEIKEFALTEWFIQIGGLDQVGHLAPPRRLRFMTWSSENWLTAIGAEGVTSPADVKRRSEAEIAAGERWDQLMANMHFKRQPSSGGGSTALMVTPVSSEMLVSGILAEAVMLQRALGRVSSLLGGATKEVMTPGMAYLHYHAGTDQMKRILISAVIPASKSSGARYKPLRDAIRVSLTVGELTSRMTTIDEQEKVLRNPAAAAAERTDAEDKIRILTDEQWTAVSLWLGSGDHLTLLSDFVETADASLWGPWKEHRGNLSRYNLLKAYYELL